MGCLDDLKDFLGDQGMNDRFQLCQSSWIAENDPS